MNYTKQDVIEMKELLVDNYYRCLALEAEPEVDDIVYTLKDDKIVAVKYVGHGMLCITDIFDDYDKKFFVTNFGYDLSWEKELLDTSCLLDSFNGIVRVNNVNASECTEVISSEYSGSKSIFNYSWSSYGSNNSTTSVDISNCRVVGCGAFKKFRNIKTLIADNLEEIGDNAFDGCEAIESLNFGKVRTVGKRAFKDMHSLVSIDLSSAEVIGYDAFKGCDKLRRVVLSNKCQKLDDCVFNGLVNLKSIEFKGTKREWDKLVKKPERLRGQTTAEYKLNKMNVNCIA